MKRLLLALISLATPQLLLAQEAEVEAIVVTGTFELAPRPSVTDLFTQHLLRQIETKNALEELVSRSPWYYSRVWSYVPMRFESSSTDPDQFFKPQYLTPEYQKADEALRQSEKHSLFSR
jgi:hypothetical protein